MSSEHRQTSREAFEYVKPRLKAMQKTMFGHILAARDNGVAAFELEREHGWHPNTLNPTFRKLKELGLLILRPKTRTTPAGRRAEVWRIRHADEPEMRLGAAKWALLKNNWCVDWQDRKGEWVEISASPFKTARAAKTAAARTHDGGKRVVRIYRAQIREMTFMTLGKKPRGESHGSAT